MACDCIEKKEVELQAKTGDNDAFISDQVFDFETNARRCSGIRAFYKHKKRQKNFQIATIHFEYCPFCGKKYVGEVNHG